MKIIFSGGGTLGPVTPLLAIFEIYKKHNPKAEFVWVGTAEGPEKEIVEHYKIPFFVIGAGKWRRYFSWLNFLDIFKVFIGFFQSILLLWHEKPDLLISAGGFVSVPLHWAGAFLGIPSWIHQQDVRPGLAIKTMVPVAKKITTSLEETLSFFPTKKTEWIGSPMRNLSKSSRVEALTSLGIPASAEVVIFALGGGTGSHSINQIIIEALPSWPKKWHVIHLTGKERPDELHLRASHTFSNYHVYSFFVSEMASAYSAADVVVARAGFGTLTELGFFSKPSIIMPMPKTHQEENVEFLEKKGAAIRFHQGIDTGLKLAHLVSMLIQDKKKSALLGENLHHLIPTASSNKIIEIVDVLTN